MMDEARLKKTLREYHAFKLVFDILFWRLKHSMKMTTIEWIQNEAPFLCRIFAEATKCIEALDTEISEKQREEIHWKTLKKKWDRRFEKPWKEFLEKWGPRIIR